MPELFLEFPLKVDCQSKKSFVIDSVEAIGLGNFRRLNFYRDKFAQGFLKPIKIQNLRRFDCRKN